MRRLVVLVLVAAAATTDAVAGADRARPDVAFARGVPQDLREVVDATWTRFTDAFPRRWGCIGPVTVAAAWELDDRASYDPEARLVTVRVPGTAGNLGASLVHEFAHHVEFTCPAHEALRPAFLQAQGFPAGTRWFSGASWERTPSEQFAEATVEVVFGHPSAHARIPIDPDALAAIRAWARGH